MLDFVLFYTFSLTTSDLFSFFFLGFDWANPRLGAKEDAPYVVLETQGPVGCYNRANRSLFHFTEASAVCERRAKTDVWLMIVFEIL